MQKDSITLAYEQVNDFLQKTCPTGQQNAVAYTQETHNAFKQLVAVLMAGQADNTKRIALLEQRGVKYVGTWQKAASYSRGDVVTDRGSMWVALTGPAQGSRPGDAPDDWQLSAKGVK